MPNSKILCEFAIFLGVDFATQNEIQTNTLALIEATSFFVAAGAKRKP